MLIWTKKILQLLRFPCPRKYETSKHKFGFNFQHFRGIHV